MKKIVIERENAKFSYPYIIRKGVLGFAVSEIDGHVFLNTNCVFVDFKTKSVIVEGLETRLKFELSEEELNTLNAFFNEEHSNLTNYFKNLMSGKEKIYIFPEFEKMLIAPETYFTGDIESLNMIEESFKFVLNKLTKNKISKDCSIAELQSDLTKRIRDINFGAYKLMKENENSEEVYISISMKELVSLI